MSFPYPSQNKLSIYSILQIDKRNMALIRFYKYDKKVKHFVDIKFTRFGTMPAIIMASINSIAEVTADESRYFVNCQFSFIYTSHFRKEPFS